MSFSCVHFDITLFERQQIKLTLTHFSLSHVTGHGVTSVSLFAVTLSRVSHVSCSYFVIFIRFLFKSLFPIFTTLAFRNWNQYDLIKFIKAQKWGVQVVSHQHRREEQIFLTPQTVRVSHLWSEVSSDLPVWKPHTVSEPYEQNNRF